MSIPIYQVDAFSDQPYAGNPAAVCLLAKARDAAWMQKIAEEMNLSETVFLVSREDGFDLRWFTPTVEVDLCGHATLASAHVLWETGLVSLDQDARFHTRSGLLTARRDGDWIDLDFPAYSSETINPPAELVEGLEVRAVSVSLACNGKVFVVEMESEEAVRQLRPDFRCLRQLNVDVVATAAGNDLQVDFVSRYFAPSQGIDEDPVTGSAHCFLGPYWKERLGKNEFIAHQVSSRGGALRVRVEGDRTFIAGQAVTVLRGELLF